MSPSPQLIPVPLSRPSVPPAPSAGKKLVKTTHFCFTCKVPFTQAMLQWHLRNDHRLIPCKICGARVTAFLSNDPSGHELAHFCSLNCRFAAVGRRLCPRCAKAPAPRKLHLGPCMSCIRSSEYTREQIRTIDDVLRAMRVRYSC